MTWLTNRQIKNMGFSNVGADVLLSDKASYYNCKNISLGNNIRIDDFSVLSAGIGGINIGDYVHIAIYSSLIGAGNIELGDFCNISSRVSIYSSSDDFSGAAMTNPMVPEKFTNVINSNVKIGPHVIIGSGSVILPGSILEIGVAVGALSLINQQCIAFGIYAGSPAKRVATRGRHLLMLEQQLLSELKSDPNNI
jgi:acetyltransferase-like isoleucine patch superfamily enzyme